MLKKLKRKAKRTREKGKEKDAEEHQETELGDAKEKESSINFQFELDKDYSTRYQYTSTFHFTNKMRSLLLLPPSKAFKNQFLVNSSNNHLEMYTYGFGDSNNLTCSLTQSFEKQAHHTGIRTISVSSDDNLILTGSYDSIKIWSSESFQCIRTFESTACTSSLFLPKNRFFLIGDKEGSLHLYDLSRAEKIQEIKKAHDGSVWSLTVHEKPANYEGIVIISGSADKQLKFWEIVLDLSTKQISLSEFKHLWMTEDVHCVKFSPNGDYYATSLLDSSIKVYFCDSNNLFLSLYGHKLPVLSLDISSDNTLLVSGSADKNVKIWGMDFGNCHKSIFAHNDSIMMVSFVKDTHYFFSAGKDKSVKYWDGDTYQLVMEFDEHLAEVWSIGISSIGDFLVTGSHDKALRIWRQTKEQVFVIEEEEKRMEKMMVENYANERYGDKAREEELQQLEEANKEAVQVTKAKYENLKYGEEIMAAIDRAEQSREEYVEYELLLADFLQRAKQGKLKKDEARPTRPKNEKLGNISIPEYVLKEISKIRLSELEDSLKFLHLSYIEKLLYYLKYYIFNNISLEISTRVLNFILQTHENHIKNSKKLVALLASIHKKLRPQLKKEADIVSFNLAGLKMLLRTFEAKKEENIEDDDLFKKRTELI